MFSITMKTNKQPLDQLEPTTYFGIKLSVPIWAKYIAVDANGNLFCYSHKPQYSLVYGEWSCKHTENITVFLLNVSYIGNASESLRTVDDEANK